MAQLSLSLGVALGGRKTPGPILCPFSGGSLYPVTGQCESVELWPPCYNLIQLWRAISVPIGPAVWQFNFSLCSVFASFTVSSEHSPPPPAPHTCPSQSLLLMESNLQQCQSRLASSISSLSDNPKSVSCESVAPFIKPNAMLSLGHSEQKTLPPVGQTTKPFRTENVEL